MTCPLPAINVVKMSCNNKSTQVYGYKPKIRSEECFGGTLQNIINRIYEKVSTLACNSYRKLSFQDLLDKTERYLPIKKIFRFDKLDSFKGPSKVF